MSLSFGTIVWRRCCNLWYHRRIHDQDLDFGKVRYRGPLKVDPLSFRSWFDTLCHYTQRIPLIEVRKSIVSPKVHEVHKIFLTASELANSDVIEQARLTKCQSHLSKQTCSSRLDV